MRDIIGIFICTLLVGVGLFFAVIYIYESFANRHIKGLDNKERSEWNKTVLPASNIVYHEIELKPFVKNINYILNKIMG